MDRDNARDTRAPSNRDVRLRRRTGLGGALVTGRALRRRSLNALFTRARHVHRPRQSSFASSSRPTHHPSPPLARIRGASRDRAIDRVVPTPRRRHPARVHEDTPEDVKKKISRPLIHRSASSPLARVVPRPRSSRIKTTTARPTPRAHFIHSHAFARGRSCARVRTHPLRTGTAVHDGQRAARDARRGRRRSRRHLRADDGGSHGESVHRGESLCVGVCRGVGRPGARRREGTSTSRDSTMCERRDGVRACVIDQCVRDRCAWGLCMERERDSYWTTAYPV